MHAPLRYSQYTTFCSTAQAGSSCGTRGAERRTLVRRRAARAEVAAAPAAAASVEPLLGIMRLGDHVHSDWDDIHVSAAFRNAGSDEQH